MERQAGNPSGRMAACGGAKTPLMPIAARDMPSTAPNGKSTRATKAVRFMTSKPQAPMKSQPVNTQSMKSS